MATALSPSGDRALEYVEDAVTAFEQIQRDLARTLRDSPHDNRALLAALGAALVTATEGRYSAAQLRGIIEDARSAAARKATAAATSAD